MSMQKLLVIAKVFSSMFTYFDRHKSTFQIFLPISQKRYFLRQCYSQNIFPKKRTVAPTSLVNGRPRTVCTRLQRWIKNKQEYICTYIHTLHLDRLLLSQFGKFWFWVLGVEHGLNQVHFPARQYIDNKIFISSRYKITITKII